MGESRYIKVILPLRLEWEPCYSTDLELKSGDRVRVELARKKYVGVVHLTDIEPDLAPEKILPIEGLAEGLPSITEEELKFWEFLSGYYLCTLGEIYKAAYPESRIKSEEIAARKAAKSDPGDVVKPGEPGAGHHISLSGAPPRPSVVISPDRLPLYVSEARKTLSEGRGVLFLVPETSLGDALQNALKTEFGESLLVYSSRQTPVQRRKAAERLRDASSTELVIGTRSALLLPFRNLGLIILDEEQDSSYKQAEPNPRYNGRDAAVVLAKIHGAGIILGTSCPSFETELNLRSHKYDLRENNRLPLGATIIDTLDERSKNGMVGVFSRKLIEQIRKAGSVVLVRGWEKPEELDAAITDLFPGKDISVRTASAAMNELSEVDLVAVLQADAFFRREDFRSDERVLQMLYRLSSRTGNLVVQTGKSAHPVFKADGAAIAAMLEERRTFHLPPFERLADVCITDSNEGRLSKMSYNLSKMLPASAMKIPFPGGVRFRITLPRGSEAARLKLMIQEAVIRLERELNYRSHIFVDIDPQ